MLLTEISTAVAQKCFHCGQECDKALTSSVYRSEEKIFCCYGCKTVFEILRENDLCAYYDFQASPGIRQEEQSDDQRFRMLDDPEIANMVVAFTSAEVNRVVFDVPSIHCISCI